MEQTNLMNPKSKGQILNMPNKMKFLLKITNLNIIESKDTKRMLRRNTPGFN
jgi:hypothetical protein